MPAGILAVFNDCTPEGYEHFERWYIREHLQERVGIKGFRFGRRYELVSGGDRRFFAFYEVESPDVLSSPAYLERLNRRRRGQKRPCRWRSAMPCAPSATCALRPAISSARMQRCCAPTA
jgi:hypothetical protein